MIAAEHEKDAAAVDGNLFVNQSGRVGLCSLGDFLELSEDELEDKLPSNSLNGSAAQSAAHVRPKFQINAHNLDDFLELSEDELADKMAFESLVGSTPHSAARGSPKQQISGWCLAELEASRAETASLPILADSGSNHVSSTGSRRSNKYPLKFEGIVNFKHNGFKVKIISESRGIARWTGLNRALTTWEAYNRGNRPEVEWEYFLASRTKKRKGATRDDDIFQLISDSCMLEGKIFGSSANQDLRFAGKVVQEGSEHGDFDLKGQPFRFTVEPGVVDVYLPESQHCKIIDALTSHVAVTSEPWAIWLAGGAGSGKGYVMAWLFEKAGLPRNHEQTGYAYLDVDANRNFLPAWIEDTEKPKDVSTVNRTQPEAGYINDRGMTECARQGKNFVVDGTLKDKEQALAAMERMRELSQTWKKAGGAKDKGPLKDLRILIIFVDTAVETCMARAEHRAATVGRPVQAEFVKDSNALARKTARSLKQFAELYIEVENNNARHEPIIKEGSLQHFIAFTTIHP